ncbi:uncharacterized protein LOC132903782 [Amyelois transitella]|uniref:uncharacterized protein LOC132903782 n=1 Tax=Amyelois transitella TaxID=680683 RepID=UPI00299036C6|nr:uncharacterized protein LOC132903782 [Amyelois transitella]
MLIKCVKHRGRQFESKLFKTLSAILGAEHRPTTAYHPACNGLVERLHRQLKASIKCHATSNWTEVLPLVLLGIRSAWKEDIHASAADLVYGEPLRLPGEFLAPTSSDIIDYTDFVARLRLHMAKLSPQPTSRHGDKPFYIPKALETADYVFLRQDGYRHPLESPYTGPHKVLERGTKTFRIAVHGHNTTVTINRLKPAYVAQKGEADVALKTAITPPLVAKMPSPVTAEKPTPPPQQVRQTRSGRRVHFPKHYRP